MILDHVPKGLLILVIFLFLWTANKKVEDWYLAAHPRVERSIAAWFTTRPRSTRWSIAPSGVPIERLKTAIDGDFDSKRLEGSSCRIATIDNEVRISVSSPPDVDIVEVQSALLRFVRQLDGNCQLYQDKAPVLRFGDPHSKYRRA